MPEPRVFTVKEYRNAYQMCFKDGYNQGKSDDPLERAFAQRGISLAENKPRKGKRKLSAWNKYVKNKRNHITYRDGKLNLKKMGVAFRRKQRR